MRKILHAATAVFILIPGLVIILTGLGTPPTYKILFGGIVEAIGVLVLLLLWTNRERIRRMEKPKITNLSKNCAILFIVALILYIIIYDYCVINVEDRATVYFPLWSTGELADLIERAGSRYEAVIKYGKDAIIKATQSMSLVMSITTIVMLLVYQTIFTSIVIAFGLMIIYIRKVPC
jgi:hypothetical protein